MSSLRSSMERARAGAEALGQRLAEPDTRPLFLGVVHLAATPGAPRHDANDDLLAEAVDAARALAAGGVDAILVENFGDVPFFAERVPPETVAAMALALGAIRAADIELPLGVNVLRNDARAGLALCATAGASFLRVNVHTGAMVTDQGLVQGRAAETLRERARLAPHALILADVHVKHARPLVAESLADVARDCAERGLADALIVTGAATGAPADVAAVETVVAASTRTPVLIGSGTTAENVAGLLAAGARGALVGTWLQDARGAVDVERVRTLRAALG